MTSPTRFLYGIAAITMSVLMFELALTRLFSATMYYHFAFLAISLALFGSAASGVFIYLIQDRLLPDRTGAYLARFALAFAAGALLALGVILGLPLNLEPGASNIFRVVAIYAATTVPFFFAGAAVSLAITRLAEGISRLYAYDLFGAAAGCILLIPTLNLLGGINAIFLIAALAALAAAIFAGPADRKHFRGAALAAAGLLVFIPVNIATGAVDIHRAKTIRSKPLFAKWNSFSRITVEGKLDDPWLYILIDADATTPILKDASNIEKHRGHDKTVDSLAHHLKKQPEVLIIGAGGGHDVMTARELGAGKITAVEVNPIIGRDVMSSEPFRTYSGRLFEQPGVELHVDEGRSFIRTSKKQWDLIQATMVDTWAATAAGAFALTENNLYTVEAFTDYFDHLTPDGMLTMTRWYFEPPDQLLRLTALTMQAMRERGIENPKDHILLALGGTPSPTARIPATMIFKKSVLTEAELDIFHTVTSTHAYPVLYSRRTRPDNVFTKLIEHPHPAEFWTSYDRNIEPTYDNNPFFFNSVRLSRIAEDFHGVDEWQKTNLGTFVLFALLALTIVVVAAFIIGPLLLTRKKTTPKLSWVLYFACLGGGFIVVEMAMIQKFILFLGHPVYALAVVLFSLLAFSGLGSRLTARVPVQKETRFLRGLLLVLIAAVGVYVWLLPPLFYGGAALPLAARIAIAALAMGPLAVLMGMPMPLGIRELSRDAPRMIPWAWGVNGAMSVMGSVFALVVALTSGFDRALFAGAAFYGVALILMWRYGRYRR